MDKGLHQEERRHLAKTIEFIDKEIQKRKGRSPAKAAYKEAARALQDQDDETISLYEAIRSRPYFGRVDFQSENGSRPDKRYIGKSSVPHHVISWTSPFAEQLYYAEPRKVSGYDTPEGNHVRGSITLKRNLVIDNAKLLEVKEIYQLLPPQAGRTTITDSSQAFMIEQLSEHRAGRLRDAVATIQPDQYEQIAAAPGDVMLVQGVAGSGKSIVGLHRIAYLLSPFNKRPETRNIQASRVVFFGPTRAFLDYVGNLLPSLNVREVSQLTVTGWLLGTLSKKIFLDRKEPLLEKLLRHKGKRWRDAYEAAKMKGSLKMSQTLTRYVQIQLKRFVASASAIAVRFDSAIPIVLEVGRVRREVRLAPAEALNKQRGPVVDRLISMLWEAYRAEKGRVAGLGSRPSAKFSERVRPQVERQVANFWPELDFRHEYRRLLSDATLLREASRGRMDERESAMLAGSLPVQPNVFSLEDLGALSYLDHLLNEHPSQGFHHVVLDEAQEVSPIELLVIRQHARGNGFTILGDLTQSLSPQGIDRWREILQLFPAGTVSRYSVRTSYRATSDITKFANRLLKRASPQAVTALPYKRPGSPPSFNRSLGYGQMVRAIAADVGEMRKQGLTTIGILCKTSVDAKKLHRALRDSGVKKVGLLEREKVIPESVVVGPVSLTRGLEYDAVILAGANKENYPPTPLHTRILYLAVTRAAHHLSIHWFGQPASQLAVRRKSSRKKSSRKSKQRGRMLAKA